MSEEARDVILIRVDEKVLAKRRKKSAFRSLCLFVFAYFSTVHLFSHELNVFKNLVTMVRRVFAKKLWKSVRSRRSTWRCQFGRYALLGEKSSRDSRITRVGNFPPQKSRHMNATGMTWPLNIAPIRLYDLDASESQFHRENFPAEDPCFV